MSSSISTEFSDKFSESVSLKFESKTFDFDATESPFDQDDYSTASIEFDEQCDEQSSRDNELSKSEIETLEINLHSDSLANLIKLALETNTYLNHKTWREFFCQQIAEETVKKELNNEEFCEDNLFSLFSDTKKPIEEKHLYQYMKFLFRKEIIGLNHIPLKFRADRELILMALSFSSSAIAHVSHEHEDYLEFVHIAVDKFPETIKFVSSYCQDYAQIALRLVSNNGLLLQYITPEQQNMAMVLAAINQDNRALEFAKIPNFNEEMLASDLGQQFKEAVIACLKIKGLWLQHVHLLLLRDEQIRLAAVKQDGRALKYIPPGYRDIATVLVAIKQNKGAIKWAKIPNFNEEMLASDLGQQFKEAVIACLKIKGLWLRHVHPLLLADQQIRLAAVKQDGRALKYVRLEYRDIATVTAAIKQNKGAIKWAKIPNFNEEMLASDLGQEFKEAVIACLESKGMRLQFVHPLLLRDKQVRLTAVRQDGKALEYIPEKYQDIATVLAAIEQNRGAIQWAKIPNFDEKMLASDLGQQFRQAVIACLKIDGSLLGSLLERLPPLLRTDMSVKFAAVYHTKDIRNIFTSAKDEEELAITIASHHPWNLVDEKLFRYQYNNKVLLAAALNKNRQCEIEIPKEIRDQLDKRLLDILKIKNYERRKAQCVAYYCATYNLTTMNEYTDTVLRQPILIQFMPDELFNDYEIVEEILQYDGSLIRFMPAHICDDLRYALMAVSITPDACMYLNDTIKNNNMIIHLATLPANQRATQFKLYIEALGKKSAHKDSYSSNSHTMFNSHCDNDSSNDTDGFIPSI